MKLTENLKNEMYNSIVNILKNGGEVVIRERSKNGDKYIEIVEQKFKSSQKFTIISKE